MEDMVKRVADPGFWAGRRVLITGHTGFKGSWLSLLLTRLGARVSGFSLDPPTTPSLFVEGRVADVLASHIRGDVRDEQAVRRAVESTQAEIVFHLAAQPLVRDSYARAAETFAVNVMGTVNVLDACRDNPTVAAVIVITTDKVYENKEWRWGYREVDAIGGRDPYSASKACAELVTTAYRLSFKIGSAGAVASARAGNVIGGGDWANDRLVPDCVRAFQGGGEVVIRNPRSIRPWQHVLDCLHGYVLLAESLARQGGELAGAFNFGPGQNDQAEVSQLVELACRLWGNGARCRYEENPDAPHEAGFLWLDSMRAHSSLNWYPAWETRAALTRTMEWYKARAEGADPRELCARDITDLLNAMQGPQ
jgi:CDP-glucose 4,6-dehydratase